MSGVAAWWRWRGDTLLLALRVQPRASRDDVSGASGGRLRLRLAAPPVDGAANRRLLRFLAGEFRVALGDVELLSGAASRDKRVAVHRPRRYPGWAADAAAGRSA